MIGITSSVKLRAEVTMWLPVALLTVLAFTPQPTPALKYSIAVIALLASCISLVLTFHKSIRGEYYITRQRAVLCIVIVAAIAAPFVL